MMLVDCQLMLTAFARPLALVITLVGPAHQGWLMNEQSLKQL